MTEINHDRCSELLVAHERGELGPEDASAVERHLAGCAECREELAGLRALAVAPDIEPLRDDERRRLHAAVAQEASPAPASVVELPARRKFWERHAGQFVGAAASIVVILFAYLFIQGLGGGDDSGDGAGTAEGRQDAATEEGATAMPEGPLPVFALPEVAPEGDQAREEDAGGNAELRALAFQSRDAHTDRSIRQLGAGGPVFRNFMESYTAADAAALADDFLDQLASAAPEPELRDQVLECRAELPESEPDRPLLPAFASVAQFEERESLIVGFVTTDATTNELNRFSIFVWPVGDCAAFPYNSFGTIRPRP